MTKAEESIVVGEGETGVGHGYRRKDDQAIKKLALDVVEGRAFGSWMIPEHSTNLLSSIFMGVVFLSDIQRKQMEADGIIHLYGYMDKTFPRSINGFPIFHEFGMLNLEDTERLSEQIKRVDALRKQFMEEREA